MNTIEKSTAKPLDAVKVFEEICTKRLSVHILAEDYKLPHGIKLEAGTKIAFANLSRGYVDFAYIDKNTKEEIFLGHLNLDQDEIEKFIVE